MSAAPDVVVDASTVVELLVGAADAAGRRLRTSSPAAPELLDAEVLHVLRRHAAAALLDPSAAALAVDRLVAAPVVRVPHRPLLARAWELRQALGAYDALYVALAERLDVPLVTCDARMAGSNGHRATIEVLAPQRDDGRPAREETQ